MASSKTDTHQTQPTTYILFELDNECKILKRTISDYRSMFLVDTLVGRTEKSQPRTCFLNQHF